MKKLLGLFCLCFVGIIIAVSIISMVDNSNSKINNNSFHKITKNYEIKIKDNTVKVRNITGVKKEGIVIYTNWPWLPLGQFDKYNKYFLAGSSFENTYYN